MIVVCDEEMLPNIMKWKMSRNVCVEIVKVKSDKGSSAVCKVLRRQIITWENHVWIEVNTAREKIWASKFILLIHIWKLLLHVSFVSFSAASPRAVQVSWNFFAILRWRKHWSTPIIASKFAWYCLLVHLWYCYLIITYDNKKKKNNSTYRNIVISYF